MTRIRNLIFDLDGTLIDSSEGVIAAVNYSLTKMGQPAQPPDVIRRYIGFPLSEMYPDFTSAPVDELCRHFQVKAAETVVPSTIALPHAREVLDAVHRRGYRLGIATTKIKRHIERIIDHLGWEDIFDATVGGDEVGRVKPDPEAFRLALDRLGVVAEDTMVIGDTINDVLAARAVPMTVTAVASPYGGRKDLLAAEPDHFIEQLPDLLGILDNSSQ